MKASEVAGTPTENPAPDDSKAAKGKSLPKECGEAKAALRPRPTRPENPVDKKCCTC